MSRLLLVCGVLLSSIADAGSVRLESDLQAAIDKALDGDTLLIAAGTYEATPSTYVESLCGNCTNHQTKVTATKGFHIEGKSLVLLGENAETTILVTNAGYGVLFERSLRSIIAHVTITGGVRDTSGAATDAGIVVKRGRLAVSNVRIIDNTNRPDSIIVGIAGIVGREASEIVVSNCIIRNNTWDGVALYRGAVAHIVDNVIDQGRGAGVGITWDAVATVMRNSVSNYWKGIGTFGTSRAVVRNNAVFDNLGWGLVVTGASFMDASNNVIYHNGNCGVAVWDSAASAIFTNNSITENGWRKMWVCPQVGFWLNGDSNRFEFSYNNVWNNADGNYRDITDMTGALGNLSVDPQFTGERDFKLRDGSALRNKGNPAMTNSDGTRSHIGVTGGQSATTR